MNILIVDEKKLIDIETEKILIKAAKIIMKQEKIDEKNLEISVTLVTDDVIRTLNRDYRDIDNVTDVLSFPQYQNADELRNTEGELIPIGDVVICYEKVMAQAKELGHSNERELVYLFVHSVLHLLGYDHETEEDKSKMREAEKSVMHELNILR